MSKFNEKKLANFLSKMSNDDFIYHYNNAVKNLDYLEKEDREVSVIYGLELKKRLK